MAINNTKEKENKAVKKEIEKKNVKNNTMA